MIHWVVVAHTFDPSTQETEAGGYLWIQSQPGYRDRSKTANYTEKPCLEKTSKQNKIKDKNKKSK